MEVEIKYRIINGILKSGDCGIDTVETLPLKTIKLGHTFTFKFKSLKLMVRTV